jgi:hypothetical protein
VEDEFLPLATSYGLYQYIKWKLVGRYCMINKPGRQLLGHAIDPIPHTAIASAVDRTAAVLLKYGADPNEVYCGETVWRWFLRRTNTICTTQTKIPVVMPNGMKIVYSPFLSHKAHLKELDAVGRDLQPE